MAVALSSGIIQSPDYTTEQIVEVARCLRQDHRFGGYIHLKLWAAWFPKEGDSRHGTKDDPRMVLIGVDVHAAVFLEVNKPQPIVLFEVVKGWVTGSTPEIGELRRVAK
jgi:hypothetical protein